MKYLITLTIALVAGTAHAVPTDYVAYCTDTNPTTSQEYVDNCVAYLVDTLGHKNG